MATSDGFADKVLAPISTKDIKTRRELGLQVRPSLISLPLAVQIYTTGSLPPQNLKGGPLGCPATYAHSFKDTKTHIFGVGGNVTRS